MRNWKNEVQSQVFHCVPLTCLFLCLMERKRHNCVNVTRNLSVVSMRTVILLACIDYASTFFRTMRHKETNSCGPKSRATIEGIRN